MYINENYLEEMFQINSVEDFYTLYPKEEYKQSFESLKKHYHEGKCRLLAKQLGILFEPTFNYLVGYGKTRSAFLNQLVKSKTSDELLAHLAVTMILNSYNDDDRLIIHSDPEVIEDLNYFEFHELDDRENVKAYYELIELSAKDNWYQIETTLWKWADKFNISHDRFPRDRNSLLELTELEIIDEKIITPAKEIDEFMANLDPDKEEEIFYLPQELFELTKLTKLEVFAMNLTYLPDEIEKLQNLKELRLSMNLLEMIPSSIGNLKHLNTLELNINFLQEIPITLANLKNLKYLDVSGNELTITDNQAYWLHELAESGCEVMWDEETTIILSSDDECEEEEEHQLMEMFGGEEGMTRMLESLMANDK
ncbi:MAG: leucine-rich repeat domain-containing protein [Campylobacterota bacterium]|nr:leucine-rich repeat domain-containing protein [Campylobacterota bacterium]